MKKKLKNSNIELLRIIAMIAIISHHFIYHSASNINFADISNIRDFVLTFLQFGGKFGVIIFMLITGFYSYKNHNEFLNKKHLIQLLKVLIKSTFYSLIIFLIFLMLYKNNIFTNLFVSQDFKFYNYIYPVSFKQYWFVTCYLAILLISPIINTGLMKITKFQFKLLISIIIFVFSISYFIFGSDLFEESKIMLMLLFYQKKRVNLIS